MRIRVIGHAGELAFPYGDGAWLEFRHALEEQGHLIVEGNFDMPADILIAHSHSKIVKNYIRKHKIPLHRRILVIWEPYVVETTRYNPKVLSFYGHTFAPSIDWSNVTGATNFRWPQEKFIDGTGNFDLSKKIHKAAMVQGNKFSARRGELYSLRRAVLSSDKENLIDLFGTDWNSGILFDLSHWLYSLRSTPILKLKINSLRNLGKKFHSYLGSVENKHLTLSSYMFAIVIENSQDFVSEKLFDAVRAGCYVIYVGPNLFRYGINQDVFQCANPNSESVLRKLEFAMRLPESELKEAIEKQYSELLSLMPEWNNYHVIRQLANDMLRLI